jgi:hypothetical protein
MLSQGAAGIAAGTRSSRGRYQETLVRQEIRRLSRRADPRSTTGAANSGARANTRTAELDSTLRLPVESSTATTA